MLGEILLIIGVFEILLGVGFYINKNKRIINIISKLYISINKGMNLDGIESKNKVIKGLGQTISIEGGIYLFLGSVAIYTKMTFWITIILIIIIEIVFFNIIKSILNKQ